MFVSRSRQIIHFAGKPSFRTNEGFLFPAKRRDLSPVKPELRRRALSEWRGLPQPLETAERAHPVGPTVEKVMRSLGLDERLTEAQILGAWREIVGEWFASHTCPSRIRDGVLYVQVIQSMVHYELDRMWKPQILKKLKARFGARRIRDLKFRVG